MWLLKCIQLIFHCSTLRRFSIWAAFADILLICGLRVDRKHKILHCLSSLAKLSCYSRNCRKHLRTFLLSIWQPSSGDWLFTRQQMGWWILTHTPLKLPCSNNTQSCSAVYTAWHLSVPVPHWLFQMGQLKNPIQQNTEFCADCTGIVFKLHWFTAVRTFMDNLILLLNLLIQKWRWSIRV